MILQGVSVISDIVFGCDDPTYNPKPCTGIELAHSTFRHYNPEVFSFREAM